VQFDLKLRKAGILKHIKDRKFFRYDGLTFHYGKEDAGIAEFIETNGDYECETRKAIYSLLQNGSIFMDLGANIGFYTLLAGKIVGLSGKVYSFEPTPTTRDFLLKNVLENNLSDIVSVEGYAISDCSGTATFALGNQSECNAITKSAERKESCITVPTVSIDEYCKANRIVRLNVIKMDIEGQELKAISGMREINKTSPDLKLIFEFHAVNVKNNNQKAKDFFEMLISYGFTKFTALLTDPIEFAKGDDYRFIERLAMRHNVNILAEK